MPNRTAAAEIFALLDVATVEAHGPEALPSEAMCRATELVFAIGLDRGLGGFTESELRTVVARIARLDRARAEEVRDRFLAYEQGQPLPAVAVYVETEENVV